MSNTSDTTEQYALPSTSTVDRETLRHFRDGINQEIEGLKQQIAGKRQQLNALNREMGVERKWGS